MMLMYDEVAVCLDSFSVLLTAEHLMMDKGLITCYVGVALDPL